MTEPLPERPNPPKHIHIRELVGRALIKHGVQALLPEALFDALAEELSLIADEKRADQFSDEANETLSGLRVKQGANAVTAILLFQSSEGHMIMDINADSDGVYCRHAMLAALRDSVRHFAEDVAQQDKRPGMDCGHRSVLKGAS